MKKMKIALTYDIIYQYIKGSGQKRLSFQFRRDEDFGSIEDDDYLELDKN